MGRLRLHLPQALPFCTELSVRITDLNYGNHVGNDAVLAMLHEARVQFLASLGYREDALEGSGLIMLDATVVYHQQMFFGDQLAIELGVSVLTKTGFSIAYRILRKVDRALMVEAQTSMAFYDYTTKRVCRTPTAFVKKVEG